MKKILALCIAICVLACGNNEDNLVVKGHIKGLKKGVVYLKKAQDTSLVTVDSMVVSGNASFELQTTIESPEVFFLYLDKNSAIEDRIAFFADKGITEINTSLKNFAFDPKINGSEQQKVFEEYRNTLSTINNRRLDLIKAAFEAEKAGDSAKIDSVEKVSNSITKRKYLYTVNFALNHKDSEVAPYLALSEIYNANLSLLDTINNSLTPKVKSSKYGKELDKFIKEIKEQEAENK
ncbi:DUF4369 domain-containing protein [Tamlana crocina]|uniref:DUF4369 domain-containing protein n=1 Tax=Tamlana crocina TaxID=393006 RepID=A0ABX1D8F9_9FLAO|nr:DUF4369 domain-containing protein [Tamlana crocina]NJX14648.1 DUF4369 domain-containing protein [Tamlana crocina]